MKIQRVGKPSECLCSAYVFKWKFEALNSQPRHRYEKKRRHRYVVFRIYTKDGWT